VTRPRVLVVVAGTGTGVGKTWVVAAAAAALRAAGHTVAARKPAQSFGPSELGGTDADVLAAATGERVEAVCPRHRRYEVPMAPPMAAAALGRPSFTVAELATEVAASWTVPTDVGVVELAWSAAPWPTTVTASTWHACRAISSCSSRMRTGHDQRVRLCVDVLPLSRRCGVRQPLRRGGRLHAETLRGSAIAASVSPSAASLPGWYRDNRGSRRLGGGLDRRNGAADRFIRARLDLQGSTVTVAGATLLGRAVPIVARKSSSEANGSPSNSSV
jgi:hypothetical protein